ncbi:MAG: helix-turn-helix domain-containing protein [Ruminococcus sp.]|nr:helix-turn-helix domain-containing protein [Ruminococcus sp.]
MAKVDKNTTAYKIRMCRKNCGLTQEQIADAIGMTRTNICSYEIGRTEPNLETIIKLAQIFRIDPMELLPSEKDSTNLNAPLKDIDDGSFLPKPIYSLTKDEQSLIISYRLLSDKEKSRILAKITNMSSKSN